MNQILLVEDDDALQELVGNFLRGHGFAVTAVTRGDDAVAQIINDRPDLVLLDLLLPGLDGMEVCRQARARGYDGAIVMLTSRDDAIDEVMGLQVGADDYLTKPVRPRILLAHVQAVLRRTKSASNVVSRGRLQMDLRSRTVVFQDEVIEFTTSEFELLHLLAANAGKVLSRDTLSLELRGFEWDGEDRSIDLRVSRVRKKLGDDGTIIKSVRGNGYLLIPEA